MRKSVAGLLACAALLLVGLMWLRAAGDDRVGTGALEVAAPGSPRLEEVRSRVAEALALPPSSLEGTNEDGGLVVDDAGRFVPTTDAIDLFDYYLSATGEESDERIRARILAAIGSRLKGEAAEDAAALLENYLVYRGRASALLEGRPVGEDLERRLQYLRELRREVFGAKVAAALFGDEEARWFADLERRRVAMDRTLDAEDREQRLAALDSERSEAWAASYEAVRSHRILRDEEARMKAQGADAIEIAELRAERFGADAADRLSQLDAARVRWQARLDTYRAERDRLIADSSPVERDELLDALRSSHFQGGELVRAQALDRAEQARWPNTKD